MWAVAAELRLEHPAEQDVGTTDSVDLLEVRRQEPVVFGQVHYFLGDDGPWKTDGQQQRDAPGRRARQRGVARGGEVSKVQE